MNNTISEITRYNPSINEGLSSIIFEERIKNNLTNKVKNKTSKSYFKIFYSNIFTFFNLLGLICFIALLAVKSNLSNFFFVIFYIANTTIGIIQEIRAKQCIDKLSLLANKTSIVIRDGVKTEIPSNQIVLDDIIYLGLGNQIPTDCKILDGEIEVNEALLTGESIPIKKKPGDKLLAGSFISSGVCYAIAEKVGKDNYVETLSAKAKQYKKPRSEIMNSITMIIKGVSFIIVPIAAAFILKSTLIKHADIKTAIEGASTVVIGMIPAGMMLLTSVALAVGIIKLARHKTLVQDLYSLEMLARVDTICFDKTGTITDGNMSVSQLVTLEEDKQEYNKIISSLVGALKDNNQTAEALKNKFGDEVHHNAISKIPFNSKIKLSAVTFENIGTYAFGAPEFLLPQSEYEKLKDKINDYASKGFRVLALAHSNGQIIDKELPQDFKPKALILIVDHIREDAFETVKWFNENNVEIKVISGDNPITVAEVSQRVGIKNADKYISLEGLSDEEVYNSADKFTVFGRVSPEQKAILVKALKASGHITAMTGDGVNDILALKEADCAVTVASGSDAARSVSHLVLLDNNFNSMPKVVYEGRRVINNVQSSASLFLMKTFFTALVGIITLCLPYMDTYPFRLPQMIMIEIFVIGLPAFFLSMQPNDSLVEGRFISHVIKKSIPASILMTFSVLIIEILKHTLSINQADIIYTTVAVFSFTLAGCINLFVTCRPFNKYRTILFVGNMVFVLGIILTSALGVGLLPKESLAPLIPLNKNWYNYLIILGIFAVDIPLFMLLKFLFNKIKIKNK